MTDALPERLIDANDQASANPHANRVSPIVDVPPATGRFTQRLFSAR